MTAVIDVRGLTKSFGNKVVVDHVDLKVERGEIVGFLGPNGSGKTTTIRLLCGLLKPDSGEGTCLGYDILTQSDLIKLQVGYMTQRFSFYEDLTIRENLEFVARLYQLKPVAQFVDETIALSVGVKAFYDHPVLNKELKLGKHFPEKDLPIDIDSTFTLEFIKEHARTRELQEACVNAVKFKTDMLWAQLDALYLAYVVGMIPPGAYVPEAKG